VGTRGTDLRPAQSDYRSLDDRMLVLDFQAGHPEAFVEIHHRYGPLARRVCGRYLHNGQDADEAFQETMIRVFQGLHRFNGQYALRPWIARIATNVSIDALRAHDRRPEIDDGSMEEHDRPDPDDDPEQAYERLIERDLVISVLEELPETHRTALVLRELEGRSHKEIGHAMGLSSAQAKALIHRAKGSFRRGWLRAVTERGGLAGIAMLPLIVTIKVFDGARKVVDRFIGHAGQVVQAATPEVVSSAASSPAVTNAVSSVGERVVATGMAVLIAGSVTVGAASLAKHDDSKKGAKVVAAASPSVAPEPVVVVPIVAPEEERPKRDLPVEEPAPVVDEASPTPTEDPSATESPATDPSESPSPAPSEEPTPQGPPPAPAWGFAFTFLGPPAVGCSCASAPELVSSTLEGEVGGPITFGQAIKGTVSGPNGGALWPYYVELAGSAGPDAGDLAVTFVLGSDAGPHWYEATGSLVDTSLEKDGSTTYRFVGDYELRVDQDPTTAGPIGGRLMASIGVWPDGTIYVGSMTLLEVTPETASAARSH
jgi:RNA polymerase sigma-70 factor (ECF subfamily)